MVVKDYKWQTAQVDDLYYLCLFSDLAVRSLRDLRGEHVALLKRIRDQVLPGLAEKHGAPAANLMAYAPSMGCNLLFYRIFIIFKRLLRAFEPREASNSPFLGPLRCTTIPPSGISMCTW